MADAERAHKKGEWDLALDAYRKALMLLGDKDPQAMASLYASVAEVKLAQRKDREAEANYEKALAADPHHARSLVALAKMALDAKDLRRAAGYERRLARALPDQARRVEAFARAAELYEEAKDLRTAVEVLEEAITVRPNEPALLAALRAGYEALRQWKKLVDLLGTMAEAAPLLHDKAQRRFEQADLILGRLRDEEVGLAVLSTVLEEDPTHERALAAMVAVHSRREEWRDLEKLYQRLVQRVRPARGRDPGLGHLQAARAAPARQARRRPRSARRVHGRRQAPAEGRRDEGGARRAPRRERGSRGGRR